MEKIPQVVHESWHKHLQPLFDDNKMKIIKYEILPNCTFYPLSSNIFRVFSMPLDQIKVVILGQDPYPNGEAIGLAFAVKQDFKTPASLRVIETEVRISQLNNIYNFEHSLWKNLNHWEEQGVFLLNTALTVEEKKAGSHLGYWQWFTKEVIKIISENNPCIWMLWGAKAQGYKDYIFNNYKFDNSLGLIRSPKVNYILEAPHPAAELYAGKSGKTFSGCNHFNLCNEVLTLQNKKIINW